DEIVVHRRPGFAVPDAALLADGAPPAAGRADPPRGPPTHRFTGDVSLVGEVAVAELRILTVCVEQGVGSMRFDALGIGDRVLQPPVVGLASNLKYPARHRDGNPVSGELAHERVPPFPGRFA